MQASGGRLSVGAFDVESLDANAWVVDVAALVMAALERADSGLSKSEREKLSWHLSGVDVEGIDVDVSPDDDFVKVVAKQVLARVRTEIKDQTVDISMLDRLILKGQERQKAQSYYDVARYVANKYGAFGKEAIPDVVFGSSNFSNADEVLRLWWQAIKHGRKGEKGLNPLQLGLVLLGSAANVPIESMSIKDDQLEQARATGHGLNLGMILGTGALTAAGLATVGTVGMVPALLAFLAMGAAVTGGTVLPFAGRGEKGANKPAHELAHALQYLVLGLALRRKILETPADLISVQNTQKFGYLWGGDTETATRSAETTGKLDAIFKCLKLNAQAVFLKHYPARAKEKSKDFDALVDEVWNDVRSRYPHVLEGAPS